MRCDIIIPVWNNLSLTKDCIEHIIKNTGGDYSIIIIDNASDAGTAGYLDGIKSEGKPRISVIRNEVNVGFIKAVNQGIAASEAPYVCILNNDTVVTKGWLGEMLNIAESSADIGLVNPSSNNLGQKPEKGEPVESYAERLSGERGKFIELGSAIGFCMLIKRPVIDKVGALDEIYGMGNFDDTDLSRRAVNAGYRCVMARGAYVHHMENSSFIKRKTFDDDFKRNREIFEFRWGKPKRAAYVMDSPDAPSLQKINSQALMSARHGNWVWYFLKNKFAAPEHSNIIVKDFSGGWFYARAIFGILKRKKKFDEIYTGEEVSYRIFSALKFIHKAKVKYY